MPCIHHYTLVLFPCYFVASASSNVLVENEFRQTILANSVDLVKSLFSENADVLGPALLEEPKLIPVSNGQ